MTRHDLFQTNPAGGLGERWREATPLGNGLTGVVLYGGVAQDAYIIGRHDLWHRGQNGPFPDISDQLAVTRQLMAAGQYEDACHHMAAELSRRGFATRGADMRTLGEVAFTFDCPGVHNHYRRTLHMDTGEADITYRLGDTPYRRRAFVSRKRDVTVSRMQSGVAGDMEIVPRFHDTTEDINTEIRDRDIAELAIRALDDGIVYSTKNDDGRYFGMVVRVVTDGRVETFYKGESKLKPQSPYIQVTGATDTTVVIAAFSCARHRLAGEHQAMARADKAIALDYDALLTEHVRLHRHLYNSADVRLYHGRTFHSNEELIAAAREDTCPVELTEKLWRYGRYLFISGTNQKGLPFPLYGLWCAGYDRPWTQHVSNENVEIIHWHAAVGGLQRLLPPVIHYFYNQMDAARENARKLYGCRGIFFSTFTAPGTYQPNPPVPVILHFCGSAGWLCRHFYEYYLLTRDEVLLEKEILPLMLETAAFYEDYVTEEDGKLVICPGVSPENSPLEFIETDRPTCTGHFMPVTKNPTIELAILKELLTNLLAVNDFRPLPAHRVARWRDMLAKIPDYRVNADGAIAEWMDDAFTDYYFHRHLSHLYPVFPGTEIQDTGRTDLLPAFRKAVDLRQLGSMTGWSIAHMAAIYARFEDADKAMDTLTMLTKVCLLPNFFPLHNDYRGMGITASTMGAPNFAPVQLDANMGWVNAVQEMLCFVSPRRVHLLPAVPSAWTTGRAALTLFGGKLALSWDLAGHRGRAVITATRELDIVVRLPFGKGERVVKLAAGQKEIIEF